MTFHNKNHKKIVAKAFSRNKSKIATRNHH